jgi:hypothetical protein
MSVKAYVGGAYHNRCKKKETPHRRMNKHACCANIRQHEHNNRSQVHIILYEVVCGQNGHVVCLQSKSHHHIWLLITIYTPTRQRTTGYAHEKTMLFATLYAVLNAGKGAANLVL